MAFDVEASRAAVVCCNVGELFGLLGWVERCSQVPEACVCLRVEFPAWFEHWRVPNFFQFFDNMSGSGFQRSEQILALFVCLRNCVCAHLICFTMEDIDIFVWDLL